MSDFINIDSSIPYSEAQWKNPRGKNKNPSRENYDERQKYKNVPYFLLLPTPLDSWYDKNYFGRVDPIQNGIVTKQDQNNLKQLKTKKGNIFVLDFVAEAFEGLRAHLQAAHARDPSNFQGNFYLDLEPAVGLHDYEPSFNYFVNNLRRRYSTRLRANTKQFEKVVDFKSYVRYLFDFYDSGVVDQPITLSGYTVSRVSNPMMSGLSIELAKEDHSDDYTKYKKFIKDINFRYFVKAARKFGFYVDRNAPWKITADPFSPPMLERINRLHFYGAAWELNERHFFNLYYERTYVSDIERLQQNLVNMYNKFVEKYPVVRQEWPALGGFSSTAACADLVPQKIYRFPIELQNVESLGDLYWLDVYFRFRIKESQIEFADYNKKIKLAIDFNRQYDIEHAVRYINNEIKPYLYGADTLRKGLTHTRTRGNIGDYNNDGGYYGGYWSTEEIDFNLII